MLPQLDDHIRIGFPPSGRMRFIKRFIARLLWPFLHHQIDVNQLLTAELRRQEIVTSTLTTRMDTITSELGQGPRITALEAAMETLTAAIVRHEEPLHRFEEAFAELNSVIGDMQHAITDLNGGIGNAYERIDLGQQQAFARYHEGAGTFRRDLTELNQQIQILADQLHQFEHGNESTIVSVRSEFSAAISAAHADTGIQWDNLRIALGRRMDELRETLNVQLSRLALIELKLAHHQGSEQPLAIERPAALPGNAILLAAAKAFSGSRTERTSRSRAYLSSLPGDSLKGPVIDLTWDAGTWHDALHEHSLEVRRLDPIANRTPAGTPQPSDPIACLRKLEPGSIGGIVGSGIAEQIPMDQVIQVLELALIALRPGGWLIFESQNVENVTIGSSPLSANPLVSHCMPPQLLAFIASAVGLSDVAVQFSESGDPEALPVPMAERAPWAPDLAPVVDLLNRALLAPSYYAVIGWRR